MEKCWLAIMLTGYYSIFFYFLIEGWDQANIILENVRKGKEFNLSDLSPSPSKRVRVPPERYSPSGTG